MKTSIQPKCFVAVGKHRKQNVWNGEKKKQFFIKLLWF